MSAMPSGDLVSAARDTLAQFWEQINDDGTQREVNGAISDAVRDAITRSISSKTKTYRYVLPTQLIAKLCDHSRDCRSLQASYPGEGAFDARTIAHKVVVPFDQENHGVLGGSRQPYVNNPLRVPGVLPEHAGQQKNKKGSADLCTVLDAVQSANDENVTRAVLKLVLVQIHDQLLEVQVEYPVPIRISLERTIQIVNEFLHERSGGDRVQAVAGALFLIIGRRLGLYEHVNRAPINTADASSGLVADLECIADDGRVVLAVEVKDTALTIAHIDAKLERARSKQVSEILFVAQQGIASPNEGALPEHIERSFTSGQNVYVFELTTLGKVALALMGEGCRSEFLRTVGGQLDEFQSDLRHRRARRDLLANV